MADARQSWRVASDQLLQRREWDGEAVLFNNVSGATHLLSSTAVWVLDRLRSLPSDAAILARALDAAIAAEAGFEPQTGHDADTDPAQLDELLNDLHHMHLIQPC